jgi:hypothetical protein
MLDPPEPASSVVGAPAAPEAPFAEPAEPSEPAEPAELGEPAPLVDPPESLSNLPPAPPEATDESPPGSPVVLDDEPHARKKSNEPPMTLAPRQNMSRCRLPILELRRHGAGFRCSRAVVQSDQRSPTPLSRNLMALLAARRLTQIRANIRARTRGPHGPQCLVRPRALEQQRALRSDCSKRTSAPQWIRTTDLRLRRAQRRWPGADFVGQKRTFGCA